MRICTRACGSPSEIQRASADFAARRGCKLVSALASFRRALEEFAANRGLRARARSLLSRWNIPLKILTLPHSEKGKTNIYIYIYIYIEREREREREKGETEGRNEPAAARLNAGGNSSFLFSAGIASGATSCSKYAPVMSLVSFRRQFSTTVFRYSSRHTLPGEKSAH